jgi:hypothetical protein
MSNHHGYKFSGCNSIYFCSLTAHMLHLITHCSLITVHRSFDSIPPYKECTLKRTRKMLIDRMNVVSIVLEVLTHTSNPGGGRWTIARPLHLIDNQIRRWHISSRFKVAWLGWVETRWNIWNTMHDWNILEDKLKHSLNAMVFVIEFQHQSKIHIIFKQSNNSKQTSRQTQKTPQGTTLSYEMTIPMPWFRAYWTLTSSNHYEEYQMGYKTMA